MEVMEQTKKMRDGSWICDKAKEVADAFQARRSELEGSSGGSSAENALFLELVGGKGKKGNVWSQGDLGSLLISQSSPSSTAHTTAPIAPTDRELRLERQIEELTTQMQEHRSQMQEHRSDRDTFMQTLQSISLAAQNANMAAERSAQAAAECQKAAADSQKAAEASQRYIMELRERQMPPPPLPLSSSSSDSDESDI